MSTHRTLRLRREPLVELTPAEMHAVAGAAEQQPHTVTVCTSLVLGPGTALLRQIVGEPHTTIWC